MRIFVITTEKKISLEVTKDDKVIDLKRYIEKGLGVPLEQQVLFFRGRLLEDLKSIRMYHILENCLIQLIYRCNSVEFVQLNGEPAGVVTPMDDDVDNFKRLDLNHNLDNSVINKAVGDETVQNVGQKKGVNEIRGVCLVISNEKFEGEHMDRLGNNVDEDNIRNTFTPLGYEIKIHRNVTSKEINKVIKDTKREIVQKHKIFIMFIMSHGEEGCVILSDGVRVTFEDIWKPFANDTFLRFTGKPKLFFFVCCQGRNFNKGVNTTLVSSDDNDVEHDGGDSRRERYPAVADLFFGYATCERFLSGRKKKDGTFYVKHMCNVIQMNKTWPISDIHQKVQSMVSKLPINKDNDYQMPYYTSMLTEHAYLVDQEE